MPNYQPIEWARDGKSSADGEWEIEAVVSRDPADDGLTWRWFPQVPDAVSYYRDQHPGDTDAWVGHYSVTLDEMHEQADRLLKKATKRRRAAA
jgi:hypothetical protein